MQAYYSDVVSSKARIMYLYLCDGTVLGGPLKMMTKMSMAHLELCAALAGTKLSTLNLNELWINITKTFFSGKTLQHP